MPPEGALAVAGASCIQVSEGPVEAAGNTGGDSAPGAVPGTAATGSCISGRLRQEGAGAGSASAEPLTAAANGQTKDQAPRLDRGSSSSSGSRVFRGLLVVLGVLVVLAVGFLAAAVLAKPEPVMGGLDALFALDDSDIGVLAGFARQYAL